ncbi:MAG: hypothetical protein PVI95_03420, partial [Dehalococcoidia bacterium]
MAVCLVVVGIVLGVVLTRGRGPEDTLSTFNVTRGDIVKSVIVDGNLQMPGKAYLLFGMTGKVT